MNANFPPQKQITGLVLAGGRSIRMGCDKAFIRVDDKRMIDHVVERLKPQISHLIISANECTHRYQAYGTVVKDRLTGYRGPLSGIEAALKMTKTNYLGVVPCDNPNLPRDLFERLLNAMTTDPCDVIYVLEQKEDILLHHPLLCLIKVSRSLYKNLRRYLDQGYSRVTDWYSQIHARGILFHDPASLLNINTANETIDQSNE